MTTAGVVDESHRLLVYELTKRGVSFKVLTAHGAPIDTITPAGKLVFGIFAALSEFERKLLKTKRR